MPRYGESLSCDSDLEVKIPRSALRAEGGSSKVSTNWFSLQGTNISHLGKRKILFKSAFKRGYVSFLEGIRIPY